MDDLSKYWKFVELRSSGRCQIYEIEEAKAFLQQEFSDFFGRGEVSNQEIQRQLVEWFQAKEEILSRDDPRRKMAELCLRCFISQQIERVCFQLEAQFGSEYGFSRYELFPLVLDDVLDDLKDSRRQVKRNQQSAYQPLAAEILQTFDPEQGSLSTWTTRLVKHHRELNAFLLERGVYLVSDWAILNDTSSSQLERILTHFHNFTLAEIQQATQLLVSYHQIYRTHRDQQRQQQIKGPCKPPTEEQLSQIADQLSVSQNLSPEEVLHQLQKLAALLREYRIHVRGGSLTSSLETPLTEVNTNVIGGSIEDSLDASLHLEVGRVYAKSGRYEEAISSYQQVLNVISPESMSLEWAETMNELGQAYLNRTQGNQADNLERAIYYYQQALLEYTRNRFPRQWANTQNNLGNAYFNCIQGERAENIERAISYFSTALKVFTRQNFPEQWVITQNNLGEAYLERIRGTKAENLEQAISCFQATLTVYTRETFPFEWASTCKNLGNAYTEKIHSARLSNIDGLTNIEYAILYYQDALEVYTQEAFPEEWASLRDNLVNAHYILESYQRELKVSSFPQPITRNEALSRIELVRENILDLQVDAIVRPTNTSLSFGGDMSTEMLARLEPEFYEKLRNQPKPSIGEVLVTDASSLSARYIFHTPIDHNVDATVTTISQAITAALTTAESLGDVQTIAFPSVGTGLRGLSSADLAPKILRIVTTHLEHGSQLEKVIFAFRHEFAYRTYVGAYQMLLLEAAVAYEVFMAISPEAALVGGEIAVLIDLRQVGTTDVEAYVLQVPRSEAAGAELNILLTAPGFQFNGDNTASLPLDQNTGHITQTACFRLTALRPGTATITAELYCGDIFEINLEANVQVAGFEEVGLPATRISTQPRPVPQPDFILRVQTAWNESNSACRFQYQLKSFRLPSLFPEETNYHSESLSSSWIEQMRGLLETTLENISDALPEDGRSHLTSLGQYLFQHLLPSELQTDFRTLIPRDRTFTLLILADQDASLPWELLHDGQQFLSDRFIIGRWFWELNDTRPHEFPVGAINIAHYADVEQPELWTALLEPPGSPLPLPLPEGVLSNLDSTEAMRGLHLIRYSQPSDTANRRNAPVTLDDTNNAQDIERQMRPAKLNLRRNRPLVSLGYVRRDRLELTTIEQTWASAFIRAGCSAFTGSLWAVEPAVETAFISSFYNRLWTGDSLGEAFHTSRQLARAVAPDSLDWLAYVLFGDPMARPYRPVEGKGYAVVEPIGREIDDPLPPGVPVRFRLSLRRTPPVWHEERVIEVAENLTFENLQAHVKTFGLQVTPDSPIAMSLAPTGNYLGWFTLVAPPEMAGNSALVQVFLMDRMLPIHSLMFSLNIENEGS